ncbi:hypothetical protein NDU88_005425 [Pleurodeles waltl]|uniref:Uncharacterized protein n=1 Tax=Pleurodeles waltl TaxID=8319 RepID=A0AAV7WZH2_PLEWA|nr:hypothetical protein NDU88_005425 [Pleurodeles waltl]
MTSEPGTRTVRSAHSRGRGSREGKSRDCRQRGQRRRRERQQPTPWGKRTRERSRDPTEGQDSPGKLELGRQVLLDE